jgi:hypothetical protein
MRTSTALLTVLASLLVMGCSGGSGLTTGTLFGGGEDNAKQQVAAPPKADPSTRAFQVGSVAARAQKCGYNFDSAKLQASFLANEAAQGIADEQIERARKIYDIAYRGVSKGVAEQAAYCSKKRTAAIKKDLTRYLAGDFSARPTKVAKKDSGGLFSGWGGSGSSAASPASVKPSTYDPF